MHMWIYTHNITLALLKGIHPFGDKGEELEIPANIKRYRQKNGISSHDNLKKLSDIESFSL